MNKSFARTVLMAAIAASAVISCQKQETVDPQPSRGVTFIPSVVPALVQDAEGCDTKAVGELADGQTVYLTEIKSAFDDQTATKSAPVTSLYSSFACSGYKYPLFNDWTGNEIPELFFNQTVNGSGSSWSFASGDFKWPGASYAVRIYGVSPATAENLSVVSTASDPGAPVIEYTVKNDVASQLDLLEGVSDADAGTNGIQDYEGAGGESVKMIFRHALAGVRVKTSDFGFDGTIKSVSLKGVMSKGRTQLMSGTWTNLSTPADYSITPALTVNGSGDCTTADAYTFLVIPQTFAAGAELCVTFKQGEREFELNASLAGKSIQANVLTSYVLTLDPAEITSGIKAVSPDDFTNTTSSASKTVSIKSYTVHNTGVTRAEPWTISGYSTNGGSTFSTTKPDWITLSRTSGTGGNTGEDIVITVGARTLTGGTGKIFVPSETEDINYNTALKAMSEVGTSSSPVDLSLKDYLGNDIASSTTANCYVVHQPGWYKIPLVYGNAIKNGATNSAAFYNATASTAFEDSWGAVFTASSSPYVKDHGSIASAEKLWCDTTCGVDGISEDDNYLYFHIPAETIEQSNILLGVKDSDGNVAWSWHIWVTGRDLSPVTITNSSSVNFDIMPVNLGWNGWGTEGTASIYAAQSCIIRLKQTNARYTRDITVNCPEAPGSGGTGGSAKSGSSPYYQWGRKDPFICVGAPATGGNIEKSTAAGSQAQAHQNPKVHYYTSDDWNTDHFNYFWDADNTATRTDSPVVKTIYDPCPAGWNIPQYNTFTGFTTTGSGESNSSEFNVVGEFNQGWYFKKSSSDGVGVYFPAAGYRDYSASLGGVASYGYCWLSVPYGATYGHYLNFSSGCVSPQSIYYRAYGCPVRPCRSAE